MSATNLGKRILASKATPSCVTQIDRSFSASARSNQQSTKANHSAHAKNHSKASSNPNQANSSAYSFPSSPSAQFRNPPTSLLYSSGLHIGSSAADTYAAWNSHILGSRNGVEIFNMNHIRVSLYQIHNLVTRLARSKQQILFATQNKLYSEIIKRHAVSANQPYHVGKWNNGTFTSASSQFYSKPAAVFIPDIRNNFPIVREANLANTPVIGIVNSNCKFHKGITHPIHANDDSLHAVNFFTHYVSAAIETVNHSNTYVPYNYELKYNRELVSDEHIRRAKKELPGEMFSNRYDPEPLDRLKGDVDTFEEEDDDEEDADTGLDR
jgi:ribosomal protein S2